MKNDGRSEKLQTSNTQSQTQNSFPSDGNCPRNDGQDARLTARQEGCPALPLHGALSDEIVKEMFINWLCASLEFKT
jgi:hypothetical protein